MKLLLDFFPIILFFVAFKVAGIYVATAVAIVATIAQIAWIRWRTGRVETLQWLSLGTGPKVKISHVFTWSGGTWDVLGTYYGSTTSEGSYRDDVIFDWVAEHNAKVNGARR